MTKPIRYSPDENGILVEGDHGSLVSVADYNILNAKYDKLASALEALVSEIVADKGGEPQFFVLGDAQAALKEYRG